MKKITIVLLMLFSINAVYAQDGTKVAFFGNFFKSKSKKVEEKKPKETKNRWFFEEKEKENLIPVVEGEIVPANIELTYISKEDNTVNYFSIPVVPLQRGDRRPAEIGALEKAIGNEKDRDKTVALMKYYEKAFSRHLEDIKDDSEKIYLLGNQYFINSRYEKARDIFSKNINTVDNLFGSAVTNRFLGHNKIAIEYYSEVIDLNPRLSEPYLGRGISYRNIGDYDRALTDFLIYKSMEDTEEAYSALGNIYLLKENYREAERILRQGRKLYPQSKLINDLLVKAYGK